MTAPAMATGTRSVPRSIGAVVAGFFAVAILSTIVDIVLHSLNFYPPWGQPMFDPTQNAVALAYRLVFNVMGGYLTARLAPHSPMKHAIILGAIGTVVGAAGAYVGIKMNLGPAWYPVLLALSGLPCCWLGGAWYVRRAVRS